MQCKHATLFAPLFGAFCALVESSHRLVSTTNLQLVPVCFVVSTLVVGTLHLSLVDIVPCALSTQDVLDFLLLHVLALVVALVDDELVRTGETFEAVLTDVIFRCGITGRDSGNAQHVAACGAEEQHGGTIEAEVRSDWLAGRAVQD